MKLHVSDPTWLGVALELKGVVSECQRCMLPTLDTLDVPEDQPHLHPRSCSAAEACVLQQRAAHISASSGTLAVGAPAAMPADSSHVAGAVLPCAHMCPVQQRCHQLACALLPLPLLTDASSLSEHHSCVQA